MKITAVDSKNDLFFIENILPDSLLEQIESINLWQHPWEIQQMQSDWKRRKLVINEHSVLSQIDYYYNQALDAIALATNTEFDHKTCWSAFWLDYAGFDCPIHLDGAERGFTPPMAMQIYLTESPDNLGTVWYYDSDGQHVRYSFPYRRNTGYLMLNHAEQYHGMLTPIPENHLRLSSYTYFGKFNHK